MSLDKAIAHGKEHRKPYYGSEAIDKSCRCHGGGIKWQCKYCLGNRQYKYIKNYKKVLTTSWKNGTMKKTKERKKIMAKIRIEKEIACCYDCPCCHSEGEYGYCCRALPFLNDILNDSEVYEKINKDCPFIIDN